MKTAQLKTFTVHGAERLTGEERTMVIHAADRSGAEADAAARGLLVSNVQENSVQPATAQADAVSMSPRELRRVITLGVCGGILRAGAIILLLYILIHLIGVLAGVLELSLT